MAPSMDIQNLTEEEHCSLKVFHFKNDVRVFKEEKGKN